ncbi:integrase core domain-containing protein [Azospira restricta]|uniref:integrase core domain-containing protein n=1 Tax=Azospira restricta TaxID=404405 RepID=UPI00193C301F|nr:integrase core domain-containing protein [Azospira restricta]
MTALSQSIKRKLSLLQLADELGNVARAMQDHWLSPRHLLLARLRQVQQLEDAGHRLRSPLRARAAVLRRAGVPVQAILTDNGREFCGKPESHPYELLLAIEDIEHRNTKVRSPRTNGLVERMNRRLLGECFRVKGRETFYLSIDEIQRDLDEFMGYYNLDRTHQGYRLGGRTPALREALGMEALPNLRFDNPAAIENPTE